MAVKQLDALAVSAFCESMSMLLKAGSQPDEAVSLLLEDSKTGNLTEALQTLHAQLEQGSCMSDAAAACGWFPKDMCRLMAIGEQTGHLDDTMAHLASYYQKRKAMEQTLRRTASYPAAMVLLIAAVLALLIFKVLPVFKDVYDRMTGSLAESAYGYVRWAYGLCWVALILMLVLILAFLAALALSRSKKGSAHIHGWFYTFPTTRPAGADLSLSRVLNSMALLISSGVNQDDALDDSIGLAESPAVTQKLQSCRAHMQAGDSFAQASQQEKLLESVYGKMLYAGDRSGNLSETLFRLADMLEQSGLERVERIAALSDPILSGLLMFTVGLSLISVMLPLIGIVSSIG